MKDTAAMLCFEKVLMPGQAVALGSSPAAPPPSSPVPTASSTGGGVHACCGSAGVRDPVTGQSLCSCQYDAQLLNYQRLAAGLPINMYGTAAAYGAEAAFLPLASEQSAFYSPTGNGFDLKENLEVWRTLPYPASMYYPYDTAAMAGYPFGNGYGIDVNGARRKNATRETTSTLKAWLSEHRKNPYPTKGEKIMLAIITKMTLTQVSTWFANARRRLKKENKMTWSPRNRCEDDDDDETDAEEGRSNKDEKDLKTSSPCQKVMSEDIHRKQSQDCGDCRLRSDNFENVGTDVVDMDEDSKSSIPNEPELCRNTSHGKEIKPRSPSSDVTGGSDSESSQQSVPSSLNCTSSGRTSTVTNLQSAVCKPRIWSIVDTATSSTGSLSRFSSSSHKTNRLEYATPCAKPAWLANTLGGQCNPGSLPIFPPVVQTQGLVSPPRVDSATTSLNRLRTAFSGVGDLTKLTFGAPGLGLSGTRPQSTSEQTSGSSAALAAVTSLNPVTSVANTVVS